MRKPRAFASIWAGASMRRRRVRCWQASAAISAKRASTYGAWQIVAEDPEGNVFRLKHRG
jgi:hypothetical protein